MREQWKPMHIVAIVFAIVIGVVAAPVAVGAATGTIVNIVDGANAARVAKVDSSGRLYTMSWTKAAAPAQPFHVTGAVQNYYTVGGYYVVQPPTSATLAITRIGF